MAVDRIALRARNLTERLDSADVISGSDTGRGDMGVPAPGRSVFVCTQDGLRIHVREFGPRSAPGLPVVCLPGLTRTTADFDSLPPRLAGARRLIAIDSRGRGQSDYDPNPQNYNAAVELSDVMRVLAALAIGPAVFVGSSRGGILTMLLAAAAHPPAVVGAVLHDIGPVIESQGIARIQTYVGKLPHPPVLPRARKFSGSCSSRSFQS